jgi:hypothetical protein
MLMNHFVLMSLIVICLIINVQLCSAKALMKELWGKNTQLQYAENGEPLSITSIAVDKDTIYCYDLSDRSLKLFNSKGTFIKKIPLASIGRGTYVGDDFIVLGNRAVFINTVDKKLEYIFLPSGEYDRSEPLPVSVLGLEKKRSMKIINRIYNDNGTIVLGNAYRLFNYSSALSKGKMSIAKKSPPKQTWQYSFYSSGKIIYREHKQLVLSEYKKVPAINSPVPFSGKQHFVLDGILYAGVVDSTGFSIIEVK